MYLLLVALASFCTKIRTEEYVPKYRELYLDSPCAGKVSHLKNNISCHLKETYDIPLVEDDSPFTENTIFFIETTCNGVLNYRQACSVESAARTHPHRQIIVFFLGPVTVECLSESPMYDVLSYSNVNIHRLNINKYLKGTPLESLLNTEALVHNRFPIINLSIVLRFVTLYKFGGIYLDLDVIMAKSLDTLKESRNWIGREDQYAIGSALIGLRKHGVGKIVAKEVLRLLKDRFSICSWDQNCLDVVTQVLRKICSTSVIDRMTKSTCQGFEVYPQDYFYPVKAKDWRQYFSRQSMDIPEKPISFHMWNHLSWNEPLFDDSYYGQLMRKYCPKVFKVMLDNVH